MNKMTKLSNAIGNLDDRFLLEAMEYHSHLAAYRKLRLFAAIAASICLMITAAVLLHRDEPISITVYAYGSNEMLADGKAILMPGKISDNGEMQGHPLMFYVLGSEIESIRFSCKNEWISFADWTEQRGDYGLSKNFTVAYGSREEDYYYLVVDWVPQNIIRRLTDHPELRISDLSQEEKEDIIVMEITYLNGKTETAAIQIKLNRAGEFEAFIDQYQITEEDRFVHQPDSLPTEAAEKDSDEKYVAQVQQENTENNDAAAFVLSEEELERIRLTAEKYYDSINQKMLDFTQADAVSSFNREYEGYEPGEVVLFEVSVEKSESKRYIAIGSKDGWNNCSVLNEGY